MRSARSAPECERSQVPATDGFRGSPVAFPGRRNADYDLPARATAFQVAQSCGRFIEREHSVDESPDCGWSRHEKECSRVETLNTALLGRHSQNDAEMWLGSGNFPSVHIRHLFEPYPAIRRRAGETSISFARCLRGCAVSPWLTPVIGPYWKSGNGPFLVSLGFEWRSLTTCSGAVVAVGDSDTRPGLPSSQRQHRLEQGAPIRTEFEPALRREF